MNEKPAPITDEEFALRQKQSRRMMLVIVAVFVLPFFIAPLFNSPDRVGRTNKGTLIQPHIPLVELQLTQANGEPFAVEQLNRKWTLLYVIPSACDAVCIGARNHALYAMRQVRLSLDRSVDRVQQLLVLTAQADAELEQLLNTEFSSMMHVRGDQAVLQPVLLLPEAEILPAGNIFLMSPDGYVFMAYPTFTDESESILRARDMRADLKKSIKGDRNF